MSDLGPFLETPIRWIVGLVLSLAVGALVTEIFVRWLHRRIGVPLNQSREVPQSWLTGVAERLFFTLVVAFDISGAAVAMVAWLAAKMAAGWNRSVPGENAEAGALRARGAVAALLGGLLSMMFALIGGMICRG